METPEKQIRKSNNPSLNPNFAWKEIQSTQVFQDVPSIRSQDSKWNSQSSSDCTRIVCMSDTHGQHNNIAVPKGDILIHGGDFTQTGEVKTVRKLVQYFQKLEFPTTICIAGNHDLTLDLPYYERSWRRFHKQKDNSEEGKKFVLDYMSSSAESDHKFYYLEDSSCSVPTKDEQQPSNLAIYGSPWSPEFYDWAFNVPRGQPSVDIWSKIPTETDILVTHGPPLGRGDLCEHGVRAGCYDLLQQVQDRVQPRLMIFGHIHEGYGTSFDGKTMYVNASNLDLEYDNVHPCTVIDLPHDPTLPACFVLPKCKLKGEDLPAWFRQNGYNSLVEVLEQSSCNLQDLPSGAKLLQTAEAYREIKSHLLIRTTKCLEAKKELRKALLQIHAESF